MKWNRAVLLGLLASAALVVVAGCTSESTRAVLTVVSLNDGKTYYSDLINTADTLHPYIPADNIPITLGNIPNDGGAPLAPGTPFSEIVVTGYSVTYNPPIYGPVSGGLSLRIPSGGTTDGAIAISNPADKAALPLTTAATTTATIKFTGYNRINGSNNGDRVDATGYITVQVANFGDNNVNQ